MISIKKYLEGDVAPPAPEDDGMLSVALDAYSSAMRVVGSSSYDACPGIGDGLKQKLNDLTAGISPTMRQQTLESTSRKIQEQLRDWGMRAAQHNRAQAGEVKDLLLALTRTIESVGSRDERCIGQMNEVTVRLKKIATLDDLAQVRSSIEKSAAELKNSLELMTAEGKAAVEELRREVKVYQDKLEEAEELASRDALTGIYNRMCLEGMIEARIRKGVQFTVGMLDIDGFKLVNDTYGHQVGDELLKQFAGELRSAFRSADGIGRWGGDEFVLVLDCGEAEAAARVDRLSSWVMGTYTLREQDGPVKMPVNVSIGLAEHRPDEPLRVLMGRADAAMYQMKKASRAEESAAAIKAS